MGRSFIRRVTAAAFSVLMVGSVTSVAKAQESPERCTSAIVFGARGSGEWTDPESANKDELWGTTQELKRATEDLVKSDSDTTLKDRVKFVPVKYIASDAIEAAKAEAKATRGLASLGSSIYRALLNIRESASEGYLVAAEQWNKEIREAVANGCPRPKVLFTGYSQGAMVLTPLATSLHASQHAGSIFVGHPYNDASSGTNLWQFGTGAGGRGVYPHNYLVPRSVYKPTSYSLCHENDGFCDFGQTGFNLPGVVLGLAFTGNSAHTDYFGSTQMHLSKNEPVPGETETSFLSKAMHEWIKTADQEFGEHYISDEETPVVAAQKLDTVFVVDTTGSMANEIRATRDFIRNEGRKILTANPASRIGLVEYRDNTDDFQDHNGKWFTPTHAAFTRSKLTSNFEEFDTQLAYLTTSGGSAPWPNEAMYTGIREAMDQEFATDAVRSVIVIGDYPPREDDPWTSREQVKELLANTNTEFPKPWEIQNRSMTTFTTTDTSETAGLQTALYALSNNTETLNVLSELSEGSGGKVIRYSQAEELVDLLTEAVEEISLKPEATLSVFPSGLIGEKGKAVCSLSQIRREGQASLLLDTDGDGVFETDCTSGSAEFTLQSSPGEQTINLQVTDSSGAVSTDQAVIQVFDPAELEAQILLDLEANWDEIDALWEELAREDDPVIDEKPHEPSRRSGSSITSSRSDR